MRVRLDLLRHSRLLLPGGVQNKLVILMCAYVHSGCSLIFSCPGTKVRGFERGLLTPEQISFIIKCFEQNFCSTDQIWLFDSRADLSKKGEDIDLYIKTSISHPKEVVAAKTKFLVALEKELEERKIDVVVRFGDHHLPIYDVAESEGVLLK